MARIIGIDLGAHAVKLAVFQGGFGRFQLQEYRSQPVPQDADQPPDLAARLEVLEELVAELPTDGRRISATGFPAEQASIRLVSLPFGDRDQVEKTLAFEVENLVPFDLEDMVLAYRILSVEPGSSRVLTALASKSRLRPLLAGLRGADVDPRVVVLDSDLLGDFAGDGLQAVVDIGHARTLVSLCRDGHALSSRAISGGGRDLTLALAQAHDLDYDTAERRKHACDIYADDLHRSELQEVQPPDTDQTDDDVAEERTDRLQVVSEVTAQVEREDTAEVDAPRREVTDSITGEVTDTGAPDDGQILRDALAPILSEVRASLIAFEDAHGVEVDEVVLAGGSAALDGLREWLQSILGVPVRLAQVEEAPGQTGHPSRYALAWSAALKGAGGKGRSLDFRQEEFSFKGDSAFLGTIVKAAAVAAAALLVAGLGWFAVSYAELSGELGEVEDQIAATVLETFPDVPADKLEDPTMAMAIMQEKTLETTSRVETLGAIVSDEPPTLNLLREISENMPPPSEATVDVRELTISPGNIVLEAETDGFEAAGNIESALKQSEIFSQAQKGDEKKRRNKVRFTITIPLDEAEGTDEG